MMTIPDIGKDPYVIRVCADGRFGTADFTLFPQWYAQGTYYLPFVPTKPPAEELATHPHALMWYDMKEEDFDREEDPISGCVGLLSRPLTDAFTQLRRDLMLKIKREVYDSGKYAEEEMKELRFCERGLHWASICLICAPQTYEGTLLTVTSCQRYFWETYTCYDYLTYWKDLPPNTSGEALVPAKVVGTLTHEVEIAIRMFDMGVPVWLIRHPAVFPSSTILVNEVVPELDPTIVVKYMPGSETIWGGSAGAFRNRVCQSLRMGNIRLGHCAYQALPGRFPTVSNQSSSSILFCFV
jgi:hypothetical protein